MLHIILNWHDFALSSLGGVLICLATTLNLYLKGRVTGFSGIVYALWSGKEGSNIWRFSLILGLIISSKILKIMPFDTSRFFDKEEYFAANISTIGLAVSAFLVGFGTKIGNGCTSGHGVCGIPRFSIRSILYVIIFMITGMVVATIRHHDIFPIFKEHNGIFEFGYQYFDPSKIVNYHTIIFGICISIFICLCIYSYIEKIQNPSSYLLSDAIVGFVVGLIFGLGLCIGGMTKRSKVLGFLTIGDEWDPSLLFIFGVSVCLNMITFNYIISKNETPIFSPTPIKFVNSWKIETNLVLGAIFFGVGWGISGLCPGPVIVVMFIYIPFILVYLIMMILGQKVAEIYLNSFNIVKSVQSLDSDNKKIK